MLCWVGNNQPMKMRETSRGQDKKLGVNNYQRLNPHGDSSTYEAAIFMGQPWKRNSPLFAISGNYGNINGDSYAAMRYTECNLTALGCSAFDDLNEFTVKYIPNFDETSTYPSVLPIKFPNLLVNGVDGIGTGLTVNIPTHNLGETLDVCIDLMRNPNMTLERLFKLMPGPDFPTGGVIINGNDIFDIYDKQSKTFILDAVYTIQKNKIIITNIPYQMKVSDIIVNIRDLVKKGELTGITAISNYTDATTAVGFTDVQLTVSSTTDPDLVVQALLNAKILRTSIKYNMNVLEDGKVIDGLHILDYFRKFIDFRRDVMYKKIYGICVKLGVKLDLLLALELILPHIDKVIELIRSSDNETTAINLLIKEFNLHYKQAVQIVEMRLKRLTSFEIESVKKNIEATTNELNKQTDILASKEKIDRIIITEFKELRASKNCIPRKTKIVNTYQPESQLTEREKRLQPKFDTGSNVISLSAKGIVRRIPSELFNVQKTGGKGRIFKVKEDDPIISLFSADNNDRLWCITNSGRVLEMLAGTIKESKPDVLGIDIKSYLTLKEGESIVSISKYDDNAEFFATFTKTGIGKITSLSEFVNVRESGIIASKVNDNDKIVAALFVGKDDFVLPVTRKGNTAMMSVASLSEGLRPSYGSTILKLEDGDTAFNMLKVDANTDINSMYVFSLSTNGYGKLTQLNEYSVLGRAVKGYGALSLHKGHKTAAFTIVNDPSKYDVVVSTKQGKIIRLSMADVPTSRRLTIGNKLVSLKAKDDTGPADFVISATIVEN